MSDNGRDEMGDARHDANTVGGDYRVTPDVREAVGRLEQVADGKPQTATFATDLLLVLDFVRRVLR